MPYNLEIEFKNLLAKDSFYKLTSVFNLQPADFILQKNTYFDFNEILADQLMALRVREKQGEFTITLKQKAVQSQHAQIEITEPFEHEIDDLLNRPSEVLPKAIMNHLAMEQITLETLLIIGKIETLRKEIDYQNGILCLDYNRFDNDSEDYELEYEYESITDGETIFDNFLLQQNIPRKPTKNKIQRMLDYRHKKNKDKE